MEANIVAEFISKTGATGAEAHSHLQAKGWDLKLAIQDYLKDGKENTSKPKLSKSEAFDDSSYKKLARGISRATDNPCVVSRARCELGLDFRDSVSNVDQYLIETPVYTFTLPDFSIHPDDFREFLERDLIELSCLSSLEQAGRLNWWVDCRLCQRLWPLSTTGDGNCLLHAASLGMWGFHDRLLILRRSLHEFLTGSEYREPLWRRWRWQLTRLNAEAGLVYTEQEWEKEWDDIVTMASSTPRNSGRRRSMILEKSSKEVQENATYESLEEIHILALAHVLKRAIIVIADTMLKDVNGENLAPILFGGIYLPLEIPPSKCHKVPLVLTYDAAHFSALVAMDSVILADKSAPPPTVIPLTDSDYKLLPVQFVVDPGDRFLWGQDDKVAGIHEKFQPSNKHLIALLKEYLDIVLVPLTSSPSSDEYEDMDTPGDEEDIEKRFSEADGGDYSDDLTSDTAAIFVGNRSRAARQLQTVAKSFGSIGKSVSKKLKKNLGTITKITRGNEKKDRGLLGRVDGGQKPDDLLCARLSDEAKPSYQEELVKNYLNTARTRFERENKGKLRTVKNGNAAEDERLQMQAKVEGPKSCITPGCSMYGTVLTSYLCSSCFEKHRQQELNISINSPKLQRHTPSQYGTGKSTFYIEPATLGSGDEVSLQQRLPDEPLHVNRSTFYSDRLYPRDWHSSSAGRNSSPVFPPSDLPLRRSTLQDVGNTIDALGPGRYTPQIQNSSKASLSEQSSWEHENGPTRKIHSYNLSREVCPPSNKTEGTIYRVKGNAVRSGSQNSTSTTGISSQGSQEMPEIENVHPSHTSYPTSQSDQPVIRIIPISVEVSSSKLKSDRPRNCLNVGCTFYGSPELDNYCPKCHKGRREMWKVSHSAH